LIVISVLNIHLTDLTLRVGICLCV